MRQQLLRDKKALMYGAATGSASAFSEGLAERERVEELLKQLSLHQ